MGEQNLDLILTLTKIVGGFLALSAAFFGFLAVLRNDNQLTIRAWFKHKWSLIDTSNWRRIAEKSIGWSLNTEAALKGRLKILAQREDVLGIAFLLDLGAIWYYYKFSYAFFLLLLILTIHKFKVLDRKKDLLFYFALSATYLIAAFGSYLLVLIALKSSLTVAPLILIFSLPSFFLFLGLPLVYFEKAIKWLKINMVIPPFENIQVYGFYVGLSFILTFCSFLLGNSISQDSTVPQTFQMLLSNTLMDSATIGVTLYLMKWAFKKNSIKSISSAIMLALFFSMIFACTSLYFGLLDTEYSMSLKEISRVLIGLSPTRNGMDFSPYFWAMHTTFIPTIIFLSVLTIGLTAKLILIPIQWFFSKGDKNKNPLALTAALFTVLAAFFGLIGLLIDEMDRYF
ncbi:MAG: hypothetical protein ABJG78_14775 [Cyclobacteriaceae bacterium]